MRLWNAFFIILIQKRLFNAHCTLYPLPHLFIDEVHIVHCKNCKYPTLICEIDFAGNIFNSNEPSTNRKIPGKFQMNALLCYCAWRPPEGKN